MTTKINKLVMIVMAIILGFSAASHSSRLFVFNKTGHDVNIKLYRDNGMIDEFRLDNNNKPSKDIEAVFAGFTYMRVKPVNMGNVSAQQQQIDMNLTGDKGLFKATLTMDNSGNYALQLEPESPWAKSVSSSQVKTGVNTSAW